MIQLASSSLKTIVFKNCKLMGIHFNNCDDFLFNVNFQDCVLDYSSFSNKKMPKTQFITCSLREVTFIGTNLSNASFDNCDLEGTLFSDTILKEANFKTAYNYKIDPEFNLLKKAKFSTKGIHGLLDKYDIKIE